MGLLVTNEAPLARGQIDTFSPTTDMLDRLTVATMESKCKRRQIAAMAILVNREDPDNITFGMGVGWNAVMNGTECQRCLLSKEQVPHNENTYDVVGQVCPALHAEEVAWFQALVNFSEKPHLMLVTELPCPRCNDLLWRLDIPFQVVNLPTR